MQDRQTDTQSESDRSIVGMGTVRCLCQATVLYVDPYHRQHEQGDNGDCPTACNSAVAINVRCGIKNR